MMTKRNWKLRLSGILAMLLIVLTGCEAVQGYEIGQALQNNMTVTSGESSGTLTIDLVPGNKSNMTDSEASMLAIMQNIKINIKSSKMQDRNHSSIDAEFIYSHGTIPFQLTIDKDDMILNIQGAKKPIVIHGSKSPTNPIQALITQDIRTDLEKKMTDLVPAAAKFFVNNAPNPNTISLSQVTESVHTETLNLQKLHAEISGSELEGLAKKFITNILADEKGLRELIGQFYDILMPTIKASIGAVQQQMNQTSPGSSSKNKPAFDKMDLANAYLDNKTLVVEFAFTTIQQALKAALQEIDQTAKDSAGTVSGSPFQALMTNQAYAKFDLFIDSDKQIRKSITELQIPLDGSVSPVSSIKITTAFENWNINKPVTIDKIDLSAGSLEVDDTRSFKEYMFLNNLDKQSQFYKLLKDDLHMTHKQIHIYPAKDSNNKYHLTLPFVNSDGVTMVPARNVAMQLGAEVQWNEKLQELTLIDGATGHPIVLTIGSKTAHVNGVETALESPAILKSGAAYVPLRFITEALGAKLEWDESTKSITITRD